MTVRAAEVHLVHSGHFSLPESLCSPQFPEHFDAHDCSGKVTQWGQAKLSELRPAVEDGLHSCGALRKAVTRYQNWTRSRHLTTLMQRVRQRLPWTDCHKSLVHLASLPPQTHWCYCQSAAESVRGPSFNFLLFYLLFFCSFFHQELIVFFFFWQPLTLLCGNRARLAVPLV